MDKEPQCFLMAIYELGNGGLHEIARRDVALRAGIRIPARAASDLVSAHMHAHGRRPSLVRHVHTSAQGADEANVCRNQVEYPLDNAVNR